MISANDKYPIPQQNLPTLIKLPASVGTVKIAMKHPMIPPLILKAKKDFIASCDCKITNSGTQSTIADLAVNCTAIGDFWVSPSSVNIDVGQDVTIRVCFSPLSGKNIEGTLQAAIRPFGQIFDLIQIKGVLLICQTPPRENLHPRAMEYVKSPTNKSTFRCTPTIVSTKQFLLWPGVSIGSNVCKNITIQNVSKNIFRAKTFIKNSKCFQIVKDIKIRPFDIALRPQATADIKVIFSPQVSASYTEYLVIKPIDENMRGTFCIPLYGYSGISILKFVGSPNDKELLTSLQLSYDKEFRSASGTVCILNTGCRAAYAKALAMDDLPGVTPLLSIEPAQLIILPNETKIVKVSFMTSTFQQHIYIKKCGIVTFFWGDEILRQKFKQSTQKCVSDCTVPAEVQDFNYKAYIPGEEKVLLNESYPRFPEDVTLFESFINIFAVEVTVNQESLNFSASNLFSGLSLLNSSCNITRENSTLQSSDICIQNSCSRILETKFASSTKLAEKNISSSDERKMLLKTAMSSDKLILPDRVEQPHDEKIIGREMDIPGHLQNVNVGGNVLLSRSIDMVHNGKCIQSDCSPHLMPEKEFLSTKLIAGKDIPSCSEKLMSSEVSVSPNTPQQANRTKVENKNALQGVDFQVHPQSLNVGGHTGSIFLSSSSGTDLKFQILWPKEIVNITPAVGIISPKDHIEIIVKKCISTEKDSSKTSEGILTIICSNLKKDVPFKFNKGPSCRPKEKIQKHSSRGKHDCGKNSNKRSENIKKDVPSKYTKEKNYELKENMKNKAKEKNWPTVNYEHGRTHVFELNFPKHIKFENCCVGVKSEYRFEVKNTTDSVVAWGIRSFQPNLNTRLSFSCQYGLLELDEAQVIIIELLPLSTGHHAETCEICVSSLKGKNKEKSFILKIECTVAAKKVQKLDIPKYFRKTISDGISFEPKEVIFPVHKIGTTTTVQLIFKNYTNTDFIVGFSKPEPPFYLYHLKFYVKSRRFLKVPIHFVSKKLGTSKSQLIMFSAGLNPRLQKIPLQGKAI